MKTIKVKKLSFNAVLPTRAHEWDAGLDLYAAVDIPYKPGDMMLVQTCIAMEIDPGYVGFIRDRSSISKTKLKVTAGIIDAGFKGEVCVALLNLSGEHGCITAGSKIAQILIVPIATPMVVEVNDFNEESARGSKGWGSTGR